MLFGHLLTDTAQIFADVRTYWSPEAVKRVTGKASTGDAAGGFIHLINSGAAALDGTGEQTRNGKPAMKPFWEITAGRGEEVPGRDDLVPGDHWATSAAAASPRTSCTRGGMPVTMARLNLVKGLGPGAADRRRL